MSDSKEVKKVGGDKESAEEAEKKAQESSESPDPESVKIDSIEAYKADEMLGKHLSSFIDELRETYPTARVAYIGYVVGGLLIARATHLLTRLAGMHPLMAGEFMLAMFQDNLEQDGMKCDSCPEKDECQNPANPVACSGGKDEGEGEPPLMN